MRGLSNHHALGLLLFPLLAGAALFSFSPSAPGGAPALTVELRPAHCTWSPILTRGEALLMVLRVPGPAPARVDPAFTAGNALHCGMFGPVKPIPGTERIRLAPGTRLVRRLAVPAEWFRLPEKAGPLDLPAAEIRWKSPALETRPRTFYYMDEDIRTARVRFKTSLGEMEFAFEPDKAPDHVKNFLRLVRAGFYDGTLFHRVIKDYIVQGGDPNTKDDDPSNDGKGGPPWRLEPEFSCLPHVHGALSMARDMRDPASAGSQFFIVLAQSEQVSLNCKFTVFGRLVSGDDTLERIGSVPTGGPSGTTPKKPVALLKARIVYPED